MHINWPHDQCIICLRADNERTIEHVIPAAIGGRLTSNFLCKPCNDLVGAKIEADVRKDPSVRIAMTHLRPAIPKVAEQVEENQLIKIRSANGSISGFIKDGVPQVMPHTATDGTLISSTGFGRDSVKRILERNGASEDFISASLEQFDSTPDNQTLRITSDLHVTKWSVIDVDLDLSQNSLMNPKVLLKIAYEFLALHIGKSIYDESEALSQIRECLLSDGQPSEFLTVERMNYKKYAPQHGIACRASVPSYVILVMLFGWLVFRVTLRSVAFQGQRFSYTHLLDSGDEGCIDLTEAKFAHLS
ncbi:MAG: HNH endonuclease [Rhodospirillaceae bacterium]|nr:HNH endonuclease [Rhodospirillaceae bacterium]